MTFTLILGALLGAFAVVFAVDNSTLVTVHLLAWQFTAPLAIILISATVLGIVVMLVAMIPQAVRNMMDDYAVRREKRKAEMALAYNDTRTNETTVQ